MLSLEDIKKIISDGEKQGYSIAMRDIAYSLLYNQIDDVKIVYKVIFGMDSNDAEIRDYVSNNKVHFLKDYIKNNFLKPIKVINDKNYDDITFEETKSILLENLKEIKELRLVGGLENKDGLKMETDILVKLVDKFKTAGKVDENRIIVEKKYNMICRYGHECYLPTKEDLMDQYNLVEKGN